MSNRHYRITPEILLKAYAAGIFPMAENANTRELRWFDPPIRAIIPLDDRFHVARRLQRAIRKKPLQMKLNSDFAGVMRACAEPAPGRETTWINPTIMELYTGLYERGHAHSIEAWQGGSLVGGLYGVTLGGAFFGESMFSRQTDASKIALVYLVALLREREFSLLDTQFQTDHLVQFGTHEITRVNYHHFLASAMAQKVKLAELDAQRWDYLAGTAGTLGGVGAVGTAGEVEAG